MAKGGLGELFISLGFDVDSKTINEFSSKLKEVQETMLKISSIATAITGGALALFVQKFADGAVHLNNMAVQFAVNTQAAQAYANALHQVNSAVSVQAGQDQYKAFSNLINTKVPQGSGAFAALALLGVTNPYGTPEEVFNEIRKNRKKALRENFTGDENKRISQYGARLEEVGLSPSLSSISDEKLQDAAKYNTTQEQIESLQKYAEATAEMHEAIDKFETTVASHLAPAFTRFFNAINDVLNKLPSGETVGDGLLAIKNEYEQDGFFKATFYNPFKHLYDKWAGNTTPQAEAPPMGAFATGPDGVIGSNKNNYIWEGIKKAFMMESSGRPDVYGQGAEAEGMPQEAYGLFQLHPDRQADYNKWAKENGRHALKGSSAEDQMQYMLYDITKGMNKNVGEKLSHTENSEEAFKVFRKEYERPKGAENIVIHVNSNAPAHDVAAEVVRGIQSTMNMAKPQTNVGSPF